MTIGLAVWIAFAIRYWVYLFPESPINPIRHRGQFNIFIAVLVITAFATLFILPCSMGAPLFQVSFLIAASFICTTVCVLAIFRNWEPHMCENMSRFPVYVKMAPGNPATGKVYFHNKPLWGLEQEKIDQVYRTHIATKYRTWNPSLNLWWDNYKSTDWPLETAVNKIWTSVTPAKGADGTINGTCQSVPCLTGKIWMYPNLEFEWTYTNPKTGVSKTKGMSSNEGRWHFGKEDRPLVSLKSNGTEIFRAQSTATVCSGGDGDIETSLVPMGLMLISEQIYNST